MDPAMIYNFEILKQAKNLKETIKILMKSWTYRNFPINFNVAWISHLMPSGCQENVTDEYECNFHATLEEARKAP